jgi:hypothetical protein
MWAELGETKNAVVYLRLFRFWVTVDWVWEVQVLILVHEISYRFLCIVGVYLESSGELKFDFLTFIFNGLVLQTLIHPGILKTACFRNFSELTKKLMCVCGNFIELKTQLIEHNKLYFNAHSKIFDPFVFCIIA